MTEERKEERSPELRAALALAREWAEKLNSYSEAGYFAFTLGAVAGVEAKWLAVVSSKEVKDAFWEQVLANVEELYLKTIRAQIKARNVATAYIETRSLLEALGHYMECLGVEIPSEEEEVPTPSAAEEVTEEVEPEVIPEEPIAGTSLTVLFPELSIKAYNALCRSKYLAGEAGIPEGEPRRRPTVEEVLRVLETRGDDFFIGWVKTFGKKSLQELKTALVAKGFLPAEEPTEELPTE